MQCTANTWAIAALLCSLGCATVQTPTAHVTGTSPNANALAQQVQSLGTGLRFMNPQVPNDAQSPDVGAEFVYARTYSANARNSPVGIEIWVYGENQTALHTTHSAYLKTLYQTIYGWRPNVWKSQLGSTPNAGSILTTKSDLFWESLAQQLAERVFNASITAALYRFGPECINDKAKGCQDNGILAAKRVVVRTYLNARRDPMNPVTRSITYIAERGQLTDPELYFELQVPNGLKIAGPHQELLDFRPRISGQQNAIQDIRLWAHLPKGRKARTKNTDYPDYNLIFVPLRHLVFQGNVTNPKQPATVYNYPNVASLIAQIKSNIDLLRTPEGGQKVASRVHPFLTTQYYYMFEAGGQGITSYRNYILGATAGIARGLNPDFGRIDLMLNGKLAATFKD